MLVNIPSPMGWFKHHQTSPGLKRPCGTQDFVEDLSVEFDVHQ